MKKSLVIIIAAAMLAGCAASDKDPAPDPELLASASTVQELLPYMTLSEKQPIYSEAEKKSILPHYFDVIDHTKDEYLVMELNGEKYVLFYYRIYSSRRSVLDVDAVEKTYGGRDGSELTLNIAATYLYNEGYCTRTGCKRGNGVEGAEGFSAYLAGTA